MLAAETLPSLVFYEIAQTPLNLRQNFLNHTPSQGNSFQSPGFGGERNSRPVNIGKSLAKGGQLGPNQRKDTYQNSFDHPLLKFWSLSRCVHINGQTKALWLRRACNFEVRCDTVLASNSNQSLDLKELLANLRPLKKTRFALRMLKRSSISSKTAEIEL